MRDYAKVRPRFWIGGTGKALRKHGQESVLVALYLMTAPTSNMLGMYYLMLGTIAAEASLGLEGAIKGLRGCYEAGFCDYDTESEVVWVYEMASFQVGEALKAADNQVKGVQRDYDDVPENPFLTAFYERYAQAFHMVRCRKSSGEVSRPWGGASETLRSKEQEQEQEQETEQEQESLRPPRVAEGTRPAKKREPTESAKSATAVAWQYYSAAYEVRYGVKPVSNRTVMGILSNFVTAVPAAEAPEIAAFYVRHDNAYYVNSGHAVQPLLRDATKLRTEWVTGNKVTHTQALQADRKQANAGAFDDLIREAQAREMGEMS